MLGETIFRVRGRVFAFVSGPDRVTVTVKPDRAVAKRVLGRSDVRRARWIWLFGWVTVDVRDEDALLLAHALIDESYRIVAADPRRRADYG